MTVCLHSSERLHELLELKQSVTPASWPSPRESPAGVQSDRGSRGLRNSLKHGNKTFASQDFRHTEKLLHIFDGYRAYAYRHDTMSKEIHDNLLYSQLQEGLRPEIMTSPAIVGAQTYKSPVFSSQKREA